MQKGKSCTPLTAVQAEGPVHQDLQPIFLLEEHIILSLHFWTKLY